MDAAVHLYRTILASPVPVIAACTGHALAAGALLLLCSDLRVGVRADYKIGLSEVRVGLALPEFGFTLAERRLDRRRLLRATVLGELVGPDEAVEFGFLDAVVDADPVAAAVELAESLAPLSIAALVATRQTMYRGLR
jgi:enoyl-CoA hydratase